ncbi:diadenylate cyclase CdaA [Kiritimatiella glycovorans]|uniref:Diadenylate cyclase n=1 Tax=Kiritimatiella glycovorans TaxID=1307763 RepID=A0A0G3EG00_9BACT|nr:diadenylate cyclase CdaA [Kiritimatiella glycovorans]AKJ65356.1 DNA integrity scanning protein DisA [Kiritimatiella glycovorans]
MLENLQWPEWVGIVEILILAAAIYYILFFFRGTRGAAVLSGLVIFFVATIFLTRLFDLDVLNWLVQRMLVYLAVALVVIFQPEIRRALAQLGRRSAFMNTGSNREVVDTVIQAAAMLSDRKIGALMAIEREIGTRAIQETGIRMDAHLTPELLASIFFPQTPLHDGGVVIAERRLAAAACLFPLSQREEISRKLGTRHRAAIGLTEETDTVVLVVSEETGVISVAYNGRLRRGLEEPQLRRVLNSLLRQRRRAGFRASAASDLAFDEDEEETGFSTE